MRLLSTRDSIHRNNMRLNQHCISNGVIHMRSEYRTMESHSCTLVDIFYLGYCQWGTNETPLLYLLVSACSQQIIVEIMLRFCWKADTPGYTTYSVHHTCEVSLSFIPRCNLAPFRRRMDLRAVDAHIIDMCMRGCFKSFIII